MPLRATINSEDIIAPFLSDDEWDNLKQRIKSENFEVIIPCCGNPAYLRTSKYGIRHFVHKTRGDCTSKPETWQHLKAKQEIVRACREVGYEVSTEVEGEGWRADVLAVKNNVRIAFEVQWSPQTWETTQERQQKYQNSGIRCCWLFKTPPANYKASQEVPLFKLNITDEACTVLFNPYSYESWQERHIRAIPLSEFVSALLSGKLKFCDELRATKQQKIRMVFTETECWRCKKTFHIYYLHALKSACGDEIGIDLFNRQMIAMAIDFVKSPEGQHIELGYIKKRYSKTVNDSYISFGCPHCDAIVGDFFLRHEILMEAPYYEDEAPAILEREITLSNQIGHAYAHWCFPETQPFCCE